MGLGQRHRRRRCFESALRGFDWFLTSVWGLCPAGFAGCVVVFFWFGAAVLGWTFRVGFGLPLLFDNYIGRKRNVDGGVLAVRRETNTAFFGMRQENCSDGHVFKFIALLGEILMMDVFGTRRDVWLWLNDEL